MAVKWGILPILTLIIVNVYGDVYMHNPRGSNNRLNEASAQRANNNRMFDSQNNARGGYNVGDKGSTSSTSQDQQYDMTYFYGTENSGKAELMVEWTNQHGCGGHDVTDPHKQHCQLIIQYMCQPSDAAAIDRLRNGQTTATQDFKTDKTASVKQDRGLHEPYESYERCKIRERNKGLFTADQNLARREFAINTRQNPGGGRSGYECPEERDYFPYWHPTPWRDAGILVDDPAHCNSLRAQSFNVRPYGECLGSGNQRLKWNNPGQCSANSGTWREFHQFLEKLPGKTEGTCVGNTKAGLQLKWAVAWDAVAPFNKECLVMPPPPVCQSAPWTRSNHLGDARNSRNPSRFVWHLPNFPSGKTHRCVLRLRYNISTTDYNPSTTNSSFNGPNRSPVRNNPLVTVGVGRSPLRLAINTAQIGRTFQDRSHVFLLAPRPAGLNSQARMVNLNVRGKRGNIVQTYPAVEYDFIPNRMRITSNDLVHLQWTGSNTHNNNPSGGDGQAGSDGEGRAGTDRNNWVELSSPDLNYPTAFEKSRIWHTDNMKVLWSGQGSVTGLENRDWAVRTASSGYYQCMMASKCGANSLESKTVMNALLDEAPASFPGIIFQMKKAGTYHYMCSRNNNFSNRSQKGHIVVG